jgi:hypothetical protein
MSRYGTLKENRGQQLSDSVERTTVEFLMGPTLLGLRMDVRNEIKNSATQGRLAKVSASLKQNDS